MPSHLDDEGNDAKKKTAIKKGIVTQRDIQCNDFVDVLAKEGAAKHTSIGKIEQTAADRKICTVVIQKMLLHIWEHHLQRIDDDKARKAHEEDMAAMESAMSNLAAASHDDQEYDDPYAQDNTDQFMGNDKSEDASCHADLRDIDFNSDNSTD